MVVDKRFGDFTLGRTVVGPWKEGFERIRTHLTPLECGIIFDGIPEGAISRKVGLIWGIPACSCPDFEKRHQRCKHIYAVGFIIQREERPDGTIVETKAMRMTYRQDWPAYNAAQTHEQERFVSLLRELCDTIPQPPQTFGRPRLPLSDVLFGIGLKVYSTMSGRRAMTDFRDAQAKKLSQNWWQRSPLCARMTSRYVSPRS